MDKERRAMRPRIMVNQPITKPSEVISDKINFRVKGKTFLTLEYMRMVGGCTMSALVNSILEAACKDFNENGKLPIINKKNKK